MALEAFDLVVRMGTQVIEVPELPKPLMYVDEYDVAFVRSGLDDARCAELADWLLSECARPALGP